ncbi:Hsp20/alpha crystallin family protein [Piscinibacter gummiphilus]|nr:Hsp20/alpha crystallin family protein [Piscinibacter gummiphilus]ATU63219.1 Hsp20/alpha crystallin family protein [Piscinibacter gummiphilus]GLS95547.1 heat-shock protein Hsp20 [Piscinibacter gummiphilus]
MNNEVSQIDKPQAAGDSASTGRAMTPAVDVIEDDSGITLRADMPGVPRDQLELRVEGDTLLIEGKVQPQAPAGLEAVYAEFRASRFRRTFTLSRELDSAKVDANLKDGVLTLRIPKQAHAQPRRIAVSAA